MAKKKMSKTSKRSLLLFGTISIIIIGYFFYNLCSYAYHIYTLKAEEKQLTEQLESLEHDEKILRTDIEKLKDPDYIARYARETFQYSKKDEIVLQLEDVKKEKEQTLVFSIPYQSFIKFGIIFIIGIIIYVIIKNYRKSEKK